MEISYELGDVETLKLKSSIVLQPGNIFKSPGQVEGQSRVFWEVLSKEPNGHYICKVVGINAYGVAK